MTGKHFADIKAQLDHLQLVPVVSLPSVDAGLHLAEILFRSDLPVVEVAFRTPYAADGIAAMKKEFDELLVLAGTVLTVDQADIAHDAGAECIVAPGFEPGLVEYCQSQKWMVCPGAATPTEVLQCLSKGIQTVKFFPAEVSGGIGMLQALTSVFKHVQFMPTGGINSTNLIDYLNLDTVFCCGGSWLAPEELMTKGCWSEIQSRICSAVSLLKGR